MAKQYRYIYLLIPILSLYSYLTYSPDRTSKGGFFTHKYSVIVHTAMDQQEQQREKKEKKKHKMVGNCGN